MLVVGTPANNTVYGWRILLLSFVLHVMIQISLISILCLVLISSLVLCFNCIVRVIEQEFLIKHHILSILEWNRSLRIKFASPKVILQKKSFSKEYFRKIAIGANWTDPATYWINKYIGFRQSVSVASFELKNKNKKRNFTLHYKMLIYTHRKHPATTKTNKKTFLFRNRLVIKMNETNKHQQNIIFFYIRS